MTKHFRYTAEHPLIFSDLSYGDGSADAFPLVTVAHEAHPLDTDEALDRNPELGATVVLYPGDTLTLEDEHPLLNRQTDDGDLIPFEHPWLEPVDSEPVVARKPTVADLKAELDARGVTYAARASKDELEALVAALPDLPVVTDAGIVQSGQVAPSGDENGAESVHADAGDLPTPETGAHGVPDSGSTDGNQPAADTTEKD